jgi:hypothetical protein
MFYGYPISQWLGLGKYCIIISILAVGTFMLSVYLTNKYCKRNKIYSIKKKTVREKKWFYDVA